MFCIFTLVISFYLKYYGYIKHNKHKRVIYYGDMTVYHMANTTSFYTLTILQHSASAVYLDINVLVLICN